MPNLGAVRRERFLTIYFLTIDNPLNPPGVGWVNFFICFKVRLRVSIRTCVQNLGAVRRERFLTIDNPLNPLGWVKFFFFKVRLSIRTCVPNLGAVRSDGHRTDSGRKYGRTNESIRTDERRVRVEINARPLASGEQQSRGMSRFFAQVVRPGEWMFQFISSVMRTNATKLLKCN